MPTEGVIDIVCNLFTEEEVRLGRTGVDEHFLDQVRFPRESAYPPRSGWLAGLGRLKDG